MTSDSLSVFAAAAEAPNSPALVTDGATLTFRELATETGRACAWLRRVVPEIAATHGDVAALHKPTVAILAAPTREALTLAHACLALGVPFAPLDPRLGDDIAERHARIASARAIAALDPTGAPWRDLSPADAPPPPPDDLRPLAVVHTSGSSGAPRAVELSRAALRAAARASAANFGWYANDRWLLALPWAHIGGLSVIVRSLAARRAVVLAPPRSGAGPRAPATGFDPAALVDTIAGYGVTLASLVPTQLARLLHETSAPPTPSLRAVLSGGAATPSALLDAARRRGWPVLATYGLTETCGQVATQPLAEARAPLGADHLFDGDAGPPLAGLTVRIVGDDDATDGPVPSALAAGDIGRIAVDGPTLLTRYLPDPRSTSDPSPCTPASPCAPASPCTPSSHWHLTGDLGRLDDRGRLQVLGRADDVIISGGEKVAPSEVESVLAAHPLIAAACVFPVSDPTWGQLVAAALVPCCSAALDAPTLATLRAHLAARLPPHKRPRRIAQLTALPLGPTGKTDRRAVAALCRDRTAAW